MRHRFRTLACLFGLACPAFGSLANDGAIIFNSDSVNPRPLVWETDNWVDYRESPRAALPRYSFAYPRDWTFTGYSVFEDAKGRKVAEISPGVVHLAAGQRCFESTERIPHKPFRFGDVQGQFTVSTTKFEDSAETYRVHSYCVQRVNYAFVILFLESARGPSLAGTFQSVVRSIRLEEM